jgi:hypothetical protein
MCCQNWDVQRGEGQWLGILSPAGTPLDLGGVPEPSRLILLLAGAALTGTARVVLRKGFIPAVLVAVACLLSSGAASGQLIGDVNGDCLIDGRDVDAFVDVLLSGSNQIEADMNEDQVVNGLDVDSFVAAVVGGTQPVPEPSTLLLCIIALSVVGGWRKWKRAA